MSDPAVEAAQRAWISGGVSSDDALDLAKGSIAAEAAREALKPIRGWFEWWGSVQGESIPEFAWGELARLIYTTEELAQ